MILNYIIRLIVGLIGTKYFLTALVKLLKRDRSQTFGLTFGYLIIGFIVVVTMAFPEIIISVNEKIGLGENFNTIIFLNFILVYLFLIRTVRKIDQKDREMSKLVREIAISNAEKVYKK